MTNGELCICGNGEAENDRDTVLQCPVHGQPCDVDFDPRKSLEESRALINDRYVPWPWVPQAADGAHLLPPEARNNPNQKGV